MVATTCSYTDWLESNFIVFIVLNVAINQLMVIKYLHYILAARQESGCSSGVHQPLPGAGNGALLVAKFAGECAIWHQNC